MASAANLLMAYLSLEFVSLTSYVLTGFLRHNRRSGEAALKYLIYGGVASGAMIYGMSWIFGLTGAMDYAGIATRLATLDAGEPLALFVGAGAGARGLRLQDRGGAVPHVGARRLRGRADPGDGVPRRRLEGGGLRDAAPLLPLRRRGRRRGAGRSLGRLPLVAAHGRRSASLTMTLGNLAALSQTNVKRLLAYSSIAHAGYALMGFVVFARRRACTRCSSTWPSTT